jgi:hypothetical protein
MHHLRTGRHIDRLAGPDVIEEHGDVIGGLIFSALATSFLLLSPGD